MQTPVSVVSVVRSGHMGVSTLKIAANLQNKKDDEQEA
jgi:hypothetical protein